MYTLLLYIILRLKVKHILLKIFDTAKYILCRLSRYLLRATRRAEIRRWPGDALSLAEMCHEVMYRVQREIGSVFFSKQF